jgi:hypothetical protein
MSADVIATISIASASIRAVPSGMVFIAKFHQRIPATNSLIEILHRIPASDAISQFHGQRFQCH